MQRSLGWTMIAVAALSLCGASHAAIIINSNNAAPGDSFTNAGGSNSSQLVGATGWVYNNVRNNGTVGINDTYARSGNGSVYFQGTQGPGGASSKSDIEYINTDGAGGLVSMGTLGTLSSLSYDWYRDSSSTAAAHLHPVLRFYFDADGSFATANDRGYLIFERGYNPNTAAVPTDTWITDDVFNFFGTGQSANLWMVNFGNPNGSVLEIYNRDLTDWLTTSNPNGNYPTLSANTIIYGLSSGIGSGWGPFEGAVDNISIGFGTSPATTYNFEVRGGTEVVPEASTVVIWSLLGAMASVVSYRRRKLSS